MAVCIGKHVTNFTERKYGGHFDTSKDGLLLGGGIRHVTAA